MRFRRGVETGASPSNNLPAPNAEDTSCPQNPSLSQDRRAAAPDLGDVGVMRHRVSLPASLGEHFSVRQAAALGTGRGRLSASDLARPFHGVRALAAPATPHQRVLALVPRLRSDQLVGGSAAVHLWGLPHLHMWTLDDRIPVVSSGSSRTRAAGVRGVRLAAGRAQPWRIAGVPVVDPVAALFMCAADLDVAAMVVMMDALMTDSDIYPGLVRGRPVMSARDIERRLDEWRRFPGCGRVRLALERARSSVESPKESETRLLIIGAGLPEPEVQFEIRDGDRTVARADLAYPSLRIAIEYEGDGHRTSREQWRRDIQRQRELEDRGWAVIRVTQLDLIDGGGALISRIRRVIASRS